MHLFMRNFHLFFSNPLKWQFLEKFPSTLFIFLYSFDFLWHYFYFHYFPFVFSLEKQFGQNTFSYPVAFSWVPFAFWVRFRRFLVYVHFGFKWA